MRLWETIALDSLRSAKLLHLAGAYRAAISRTYYAAYQGATDVCVVHGDAVKFPVGMNNPSHFQLPDLILNNGTLPKTVRQKVASLLRFLRLHRETADYRPGHTLDQTISRECLEIASTILRLLEIENND